MARIKSLAALVAIGVALTASAAPAKRRAPAAEDSNRSLDSLNQPVVQRTDYVLDLSGGGAGLAPSESRRLDDWFASLGIGYGDRVFVEETYPGPGRRDVARVAADYGLLLGEGAPVMAGELPPGAVRVIVSRTTASVPGCPNFEGRDGPSSTSRNYGCGVNSNFAAMVADPNDLVLGQAGSVTGDDTQSTKAIRVYREAKPTGVRGLETIHTNGGNN
ncbi:MAG: CpaD family pilus assembly lipoprotein [Allosphingosinicella sp.]